MTQETHKCAAIGCTQKISVTLAFCQIHWRKLPLRLKNRIDSHYKVWVMTPMGTRKERMFVKLRDSVREAMVYIREMEKNES